MWRNRQTRRIQVPVVVNTLWVQVPSSAPEKAVVLLNRGFFSYDDVELKPPKRRDPQKIRKIFWGRGAAMERLRCFIEDKTPISGICRDESPIIRTKKARWF